MAVPVSLSTSRVLVVENDYWMAREIETWLRQSGAKVIGPVSCVSSALQLLANGTHPDIAILDADLQFGERPYRIAEQLNKLDVPYLFATRRNDLLNHTACHDRPILLKPFGHYELITALKRLLTQKAPIVIVAV